MSNSRRKRPGTAAVVGDGDDRRNIQPRIAFVARMRISFETRQQAKSVAPADGDYAQASVMCDAQALARSIMEPLRHSRGSVTGFESIQSHFSGPRA